MFGSTTNLVVIPFGDKGKDEREVERVVELAEGVIGRDEAVKEGAARRIDDERFKAKHGDSWW